MEINQAVTALSALGEANRLSIFRLLVAAGKEGLVVGQIAEQLTIANATLSFHLKTLQTASMVRSVREGQFVRYFAEFEGMTTLIDYLTAHCCDGHPELCIPAATCNGVTSCKG